LVVCPVINSIMSTEPQTAAPSKVFRRSEVAACHGIDGYRLLIIENIVYDVSAFAAKHPGGSEARV
jgi:cytochrome b involved in lipid metabolism